MRTGQLVKRGDRKWLVRWYIGREVDGRRRYGSRYVEGPRRAAERVLRAELEKLDRGATAEARGLTINRFLDRWLEEAAPKKRRAATVAHYAEVLDRYVRPTIGQKRLDRLTVLDVQGMVAQLERERPEPAREAKREGRARAKRPLSPQTIRYAHAVLSAALGQAVRWRLLLANPARDVELPRRASTRTMRALTPEECGRLREAAAGHRLEALVALLLGTGLRPGEALALRWSDLDLEAGSLRVERSLGRRGKGEPWRFEAPKTEGSRRTIPLPPSTVRALVAHRKRQAAERLEAGEAYGSLGLVFATPLGGPLDGRNVVNREFKPLLRAAGLPATIRLYDLRHTAATLMLAGGANVRAVADRLGHASAKMTLDVYAHVLKPDADALTAALEAALSGS